MREAEITGGLEHPGIVPVYGLGSYADGRPFYAMRHPSPNPTRLWCCKRCSAVNFSVPGR